MNAKWLRIAGLVLLSCALAARAQAPPPSSPPAPSFEERLAKRAVDNRHAVSFRNGAFSGPGWDLLLAEGKKSRFFLVGEEHGVAEVPAVVRELFRALEPAGYLNLAIEISPPMATVLDEIARGEDGLARLAAFFQANPPGVAFYTLQEEAELLVAARAAVAARTPVLWGLDYEMTADRFLFDRARKNAPEGPAKAAADALYEKSAAAWKTVSETRNPAAFFSFSAIPDTLDGLRRAWPSPDPESALALDVIGETLAINQMFAQGRNWESNDRRARLNRGQFLRHLNEARARGESPRVLFKFGASHMIRGRTATEVFDLGSLAAEIAAAEGSQAFHLLVVGGSGTEHAIFNPMELKYVPAPVDLAIEEGLQTIVAQAYPEGFTLIDLRPLRPLLSSARTKTADPELMRIVHGFDAILVLTGSRPSRQLP
jgi:erythromycin esterase-like protein